ncbi:hypothetical protein HDV62DRAFT_204113 [Trichoderma sp. SZMC 28011]
MSRLLAVTKTIIAGCICLISTKLGQPSTAPVAVKAQCLLGIIFITRNYSRRAVWRCPTSDTTLYLVSFRWRLDPSNWVISRCRVATCPRPLHSIHAFQDTPSTSPYCSCRVVWYYPTLHNECTEIRVLRPEIYVVGNLY